METTKQTLTLSLKKKWYDLIASGRKKEEYRELKDFWHRRLADGNGGFRHFDSVVFTLGYPPAGDRSRRMEFEIDGIRVGTGRPEWGAEEGREYFVIGLGRRIS